MAENHTYVNSDREESVEMAENIYEDAENFGEREERMGDTYQTLVPDPSSTVLNVAGSPTRKRSRLALYLGLLCFVLLVVTIGLGVYTNKLTRERDILES